MKRALFAFLAVVLLCAGCEKNVIYFGKPGVDPIENTEENQEENTENPGESTIANPGEEQGEVQLAPCSIIIDGEIYEFKSGFYFGTAGNADDGKVRSYSVLLASEELTLSEFCDIVEDFSVLENDFVMAALTIFTNVPEEMEASIAEQFDGEPAGQVTLIKADGTGKEFYVFYEDMKVSKAGDDFSITFVGKEVSYTEEGEAVYEAVLSGSWEGTMEYENMGISLL